MDQESEVDWSDTRSPMDQGSNHTPDSDEQDPNGSPWTMDCDEVARRYEALTYFELTKVLDRQILPSDDRERQTFDIMTQFELGDPHTHYHAPSATGYQTSGECGCPDWPALFSYVLDHCRSLEHADTVYILVDNRNLTDHYGGVIGRLAYCRRLVEEQNVIDRACSGTVWSSCLPNQCG